MKGQDIHLCLVNGVLTAESTNGTGMIIIRISEAQP
jgi:hypothetical protein